MKKILFSMALIGFTATAFAQNVATVSAANVSDLGGNKLASGQLCFLATDQNDTPISFMVGGGGQVIRRPFCSTVTAGIAAAFTVPNPAATSPSGIYYRVTVKDSTTGLEVLRYTGVTFSGATFSFDAFTPTLPGANLSPLTGNAVTGNLSVAGNLSVTGTFSPGTITPTTLTSSGIVTGGSITATANAGIPNLSGSIVYLGGGFTSPIAGRMVFGDGTGWKFGFAKKTAGSYTDLLTVDDLGNVAVNGDTPFSAAPRMVWSLVYAGPVPLGGLIMNRVFFDKPITVTRLTVLLAQAALAGCTTAPLFSVGDGTNTTSCTVNNGASLCDTGAVSVNLAGNGTTAAEIRLNAFAGCTPNNAEVSVQYKMR